MIQIQQHRIFTLIFLFLTPLAGGEAWAADACLTPAAYAAKVEALRKTDYAEFLKTHPDLSLVQRIGDVTQSLIKLLDKEAKAFEKKSDPSKNFVQSLTDKRIYELVKQAQKEQGFCTVTDIRDYESIEGVKIKNAVSAETCALSPDSGVKYVCQKGQDNSGRYFPNDDVKAYAGLEIRKDGDLRAAAFIWGEKEREAKAFRTPLDRPLSLSNLKKSVESYREHPEQLETISADLLGFEYKEATSFEGWLKSKNLLADVCKSAKPITKKQAANESIKYQDFSKMRFELGPKLKKQMDQMGSSRNRKADPDRRPAVVDQKAKGEKAGATEYLIVPE